jgi:hypothetical protein
LNSTVRGEWCRSAGARSSHRSHQEVTGTGNLRHLIVPRVGPVLAQAGRFTIDPNTGGVTAVYGLNIRPEASSARPCRSDCGAELGTGSARARGAHGVPGVKHIYPARQSL